MNETPPDWTCREEGSRLALGKTERVALLPGQRRHRRLFMTLHVIFVFRWGKRRIKIIIKIRI
jgi:hypothetical protein